MNPAEARRTQAWEDRIACGCTRDEYGPVYCDAHRPPPPPDPPGACVLCHFIEPEKDLVTGKDGMKFHPECAR